jgi:hypothetical protein
MQIFLKKYALTFTGILIGAFGGFLYWHFVGCASGSCSINSVWYNSTAYGAIMGGLAMNIFQK